MLKTYLGNTHTPPVWHHHKWNRGMCDVFSFFCHRISIYCSYRQRSISVWACRPFRKLIHGPLICTTICPVQWTDVYGKRTHSKITTGRGPCRKFVKERCFLWTKFTTAVVVSMCTKSSWSPASSVAAGRKCVSLVQLQRSEERRVGKEC